MAYTKPQVLSLYRNCLRAAYQFEYYNFREYFVRRTREEFRKCKSVENNTNLYKEGRNELAMLRRQSMISEMFPFDKLVVERVDKKHREVDVDVALGKQHKKLRDYAAE